MSRHLKLIAALAVVLVAISGFSPARKGGGRSGSKGGGCSSSSSSSHNNSGSSYNDDNDSDYDKGYSDGSRRSSRYNSTTGTSGSRHSSGSGGSPTGTVDQCAAAEGSEAKSVVSVRNSGGRTKSYRVRVDFRDTAGTLVDSGSAQVTVSGNGTDTVDVPMEHPDRIDDVAKCEVASVS
ncbi:MAG TPA: hypothetical protein VGO89_11785 [Streptomyces sp.]|jgi:hypothetical protein|nr:hypothetical protein [Streptomyces sp.]